MSDRTDSDSHRTLTLSNTLSPPISKEMQGFDAPIPLSPQWLLAKPGDSNRQGLHFGDLHFNPNHGNRPNASKSFGEEFPNAEKRKDVFRPSARDAESGRRDHWRDEERETNSTVKKDRWREGGKELGDSQRKEVWIDSSSKHTGESRRAPPERWSEISNREKNNDQRREGKWNTRWGPDDKESDEWREKRLDSSREGEGFREKGSTHANSQVKDAENGDHHSRPWRPNFLQTRGRGESLHHQSSTPNKQSQMFSHGRGRGENGQPFFSPGRGRINTSTNGVNNSTAYHHTIGDSSENTVGEPEDPSALKYSRIKLLDIYKIVDVVNYKKPFGAFIEFPSLTQTEPVEPLGFSSPTPEESVIIKGIVKGDITSSGPHVSKEVVVGRNLPDNVISGPMKSKFGNNSSFGLDDYKDNNIDNTRGYTGQDSNLNDKDTVRKKYNVATREGDMQEKSSYHVSPWRSHSVGEFPPSSSDVSSDARIRTANIGWQQNARESELRNRDEFPFPSNVSPNANSQAQREVSGSLDQDRLTDVMIVQHHPFLPRDSADSRISQPTYLPPEDLSLFYKDPHGQIQGPFSGSNLIGWFDAGYFGIDLQVRLADDPMNSPFSMLGDVMPHLQQKARPPPGFVAPKEVGVLDLPGSESTVSSGIFRSGMGGMPGAKLDNRFLESLMTVQTSNSSLEPLSYAEGNLGFAGSKSGELSVSGDESLRDLNNPLGQRLPHEQCRPLTDHHAWIQRDSVPNASRGEIIPDSPDVHQFSQPREHVDLLSLLKQAPNKATVPSGNSEIPGQSNLLDPHSINGASLSGFDALQDQSDLHLSQHLKMHAMHEAQQQRLQQHIQPSLSHSSSDLQSAFASNENLHSSAVSQDPQLLNLLQQQYLASQLQIPPQAPNLSQLSLLEKLLLLKKKQDQEQKDFLLQQQQHYLSQVLSEQHSCQQMNDQLYGHLLQGSFPGVNSYRHQHQLGTQQHLHGGFQISSPMPIQNLQDLHLFNPTSLPPQFSQGIGLPVPAGIPLPPLPNQLFNNSAPPEELATQAQQNENVQGPTPTSASTIGMMDTLLSSPITYCQQSHDDEAPHHVLNVEVGAIPQPGETVKTLSSEDLEAVTENFNLASSVSKEINGMENNSENTCELFWDEALSVKEIKTSVKSDINKVTEKKSRKQKKSKSQSTKELGKEPMKEIPLQQSSKKNDVDELEAVVPLPVTSTKLVDAKSSVLNKEPISSELIEVKSESKDTDFSLTYAGQHPIPHAWKAAVSDVKTKSLKEIQEEEHRWAQTQKFISEVAAVTIPLTIESPTPWVGIASSESRKSSKEFRQGVGTAQSDVVDSKFSTNSKTRKSGLHDLLAAEVLSKSNENVIDVPDSVDLELTLPPHLDPSIDDDDFVQAKDYKKNRKKAAKAKLAGSKASFPVASPDTSHSSFSSEKGKSSRLVQQEKELAPAPPAGPSFGDFVLWKDEQASSGPAAAWSTDAAKVQKATSLRDILKEQEKKIPAVQQQSPIRSQAKVQANRSNRGSTSWNLTGSSPLKITTSLKTRSPALLKTKTEDDLFWGPLDEAKQDLKIPDSQPQVIYNRGTKNTSVKGTSITSLQISAVVSSPPGNAGRSSMKGRKESKNSHSEAMQFRQWCENELIRLTGSEDTEFLVFCLKQPTPEAKVLLTENLATFDRDNSFIDKFLNYKEMLSPDVIEAAFNTQANNSSTTQNSVEREKPVVMGIRNETVEAVANEGGVKVGGGGKKKGKKGKKVNPSVLGFNVVSNRIMMGEIQTVED